MTQALQVRSVVSPQADLPEIIHRWIEGERIADLAAECGITPKGLYLRIQKFVGDKAEYAELKRQVLLSLKAEADWELETAEGPVQVARASHRCRFTRWDLERRLPDEWGQKTEVKEDKTIRVIIQRETPQPVVDGSKTIDVPSVTTREHESASG